MDRLSSSLLMLFASIGTHAADTVARPEWQKHFDARGVKGTFVLFEPALDRYSILDESRAKQRFLPASTFKIPNAVIGLDEGSITDENEVFHWDGKPKPIPEWERDHTLNSGMKYSVVWMFQEIARRTGKARMKDWMERLEYGNRDISGGIDLFWLQGGLRVSAMEQVQLLQRTFDSRMAELVEEQMALTDYRFKQQAKRFWEFLAGMREVREGVREGRHKSGS